MGKYYAVYREPSIKHHGILGMKWGRKNGPPYPLGVSDHSASEKKAGWRKSLDKNSKSSMPASSRKASKPKFNLTDRQRKMIKIGTAVAITGLAAYGGYKLYKSGVLDSNAAIGGTGDQFHQSFRPQEDSGSANNSVKIKDSVKAVAEATGLNIKVRDSTTDQDCFNANPNYSPGEEAWKNNCSHAVVSFLLRRAGLDVQAKPMKFDEEGGLSFPELGACFKGMHPSKPFGIKVCSSGSEYADRLTNYISATFPDDNASGIIQLRTVTGKGHYIAFEKADGRTRLVDPQTGVPNADKYFDLMARGIYDRKTVTMARTDNLEINPKHVLEFVENFKQRRD